MVNAASAAVASVPAAPPPPGQFSNLIDPPSQQIAMATVSSIIVFVTLLFVSLRLYSNFFITKSRGPEDYFCIAATVLSFTYIGFILHLSYAARHMWDVPVVWFSEKYWKLRFAQNMIQAFAFFTSRLPIFLLYLRLFGRNRPFRYLVYFGLVANFAVYLSSVPLIAYFCSPPPGQSWANENVFVKCKRLTPYAIAQGSCNAALDIFTLVLPIHPIWGLQLPIKKRIGVLAIFTTGFFAVIASAISLYYRYELTYGNDVNWNEGAFVTSAVVEINVAIICSSMPACSHMLKQVSEKSGFLKSLRSALSRHNLLSSDRGNSKGAAHDYNAPPRQNESSGTGNSWTYSADEGFVNPENQHRNTQKDGFGTIYSRCQSGAGRQYLADEGKGITRTMEVNIV